MRDLTTQELLDVTRRVVAEAGQRRRMALGILRTSRHDPTRRDCRQNLDKANRCIRAMVQIERDLRAKGD